VNVRIVPRVVYDVEITGDYERHNSTLKDCSFGGHWEGLYKLHHKGGNMIVLPSSNPEGNLFEAMFGKKHFEEPKPLEATLI